MRHFLVIAVLTVAITGCDDSATYSTEEVIAAFQRQGYTLVPRLSFPGEATAPGESDVLSPRGEQPFTVFVLSDAVADEAWGDYESQQTHESFDVRRANVVVISDSGLAVRQRDRVLAAMSALPDGGAAVVIAGRR